MEPIDHRMGCLMLAPAGLTFISDWAAAVSGFADVVVVSVVSALPADASQGSRKVARISRNGAEVIFLRRRRLRPTRWFWRLNALLESRVVLQALQAHKPAIRLDLIHSHFYSAATAARHVARRLGIPYVHTEHSSNLAAPDPGHYVSKSGMVIMRQVFGAAAAVTFVGENQLAAAKRLRLPGRFTVVPNPVQPSGFLIKSPSFQRRRRLVTVGDLISRKRHDLLLRAFALVLADDPSVELDIVGEGPEGPRLRALLQHLNLGQAAHLIGALPRTGVAEALARADLYVHTSERESFGVSIVEALFTGLPVLAVRCGGVTDELRPDAATVIETDDPTELARAITDALRRGDFADPATIAAWAREQYGPTEVARRMRAVYLQALQV